MATFEIRQKLDGVVDEQLPNALFRVRLDDGRCVRCHVAGALKLRLVRLLAGDAVQVEVSELDPSRGRIVGAG